MILLLLLTCCSAACSTSFDLITFLDQILDQYQNETFALVNVNDDLSKMMAWVANYNVKIPLKPIEFNPDCIRDCSMTLIDASCVTQEVSDLHCFNTNSKFFIIHTTYEGSFEDMHQAERILRSIGVFNAIHLILDPFAIVTFDIIGNERKIWLPLEATSMILGNQYFDLSGYHYKVHYRSMEPYSSVDENDGIDVSVVKEVANHQNATVEFVKDLGDYKRMRSVFRKYSVESIDLSIARILLSEDVSKDRVYLPQWEQLCVVVPRRHTRLLMIQLVKPFTMELWLVLIFYIGVRIIRKFERLLQRRLFLVLFLLVDFCLMESYTAKAMSFLINMRYDADPRTMEELNRRGETFAILSSEREIVDEYSGLNIIEVPQKKIWHYHQFATIIYCKMAEYYDNTKSNYDPDTNDKLATILNERLMLYPAFYSFAGGHPFRSRFQLILERMFDAGIWAKIYNRWTSDVQQFKLYLSGKKDVISFKDMHSLWVLQILGYLAGVGWFAVEKIWNR